MRQQLEPSNSQVGLFWCLSKEPACQCRRSRNIFLGWERSPGKEKGNPLQYSCLENPMDRGAQRATLHGVTRGWTQLTTEHTHTHFIGYHKYFLHRYQYNLRQNSRLNIANNRKYSLPTNKILQRGNMVKDK